MQPKTSLLAFSLGLSIAAMPFAAHCAPASKKAPALIGWAKATTDGVTIAGSFSPGQGWRGEENARSFALPGVAWSLFTLSGQKIQFKTDRATHESGPFGYFAKARSTVKPNFDAPLAIALSAPYADKAQPRLPHPQNLNQPLYIQEAAKLLRAKGLKTKSAHLSQLLRIDLDGDGTEEVLMSAHSRPDYGHTPATIAGDYDLAAIRFTVNGRVKTMPLNVEVAPKSIYFSAPNRSEFMACADIDGDGRMEIVLSTGYYEGFGLEVWKFDGQKVQRVLSAGWGA